MRWILLVLLLLLPLSARAAWLVAETRNFRVWADMPEPRLRALATDLEDFDRLLRLYVKTGGEPVPVKLDIIVDDVDAVQRGAGGGFAGVYVPAPTGVVALSGEEKAPGDDRYRPTTVLFHEYSHHFMLQHSRFNYPMWFVEGFASFFQSVRFTPTSIEVGRTVGHTDWLIAADQWQPLKLVLNTTPQSTRTKVGDFYAQGWLLTHYMFKAPGMRAKLADYFQRIGRGEPSGDAMEQATGMSSNTLQDRLRDHARSGARFSILDRPSTAEPVQVTVGPAPPSAARLLLDHWKLKTGLLGRHVWKRHLAIARAEAAAYPGDPLALAAWGLAELRAGERAAADTAGDKLIALGPATAAQGWFLKGYRRVLDARDDPARADALYAEARPMLTKAHKLDPNDAPTLYYFAETFARGPQAVSDNTLNVLLLAHQLRPQVRSYGLAAYLELKRGDWAAAEQLAAMFLSYDHRPMKGTLTAQAVIDAARAKRAIDAPFPWGQEEAPLD